MVWALHQEEGVNYEEFLSSIYSLMNSATKDIEVRECNFICVKNLCFSKLGCMSLALSLPVMLLSQVISSSTAMGVIQQLADIASARVDVSMLSLIHHPLSLSLVFSQLPVVHWSLGAAMYSMCSVGEGVSDAMIDGVALRWVEQAMGTEQPARTDLVRRQS